MSSASLPPLPALIPISVLRNSPLSNNNSDLSIENHRDCAPCINRSKVIDEQRSLRSTKESLDILIDNSQSRDASAAPQSRKIGPERHRKSNRQRDRRRRTKTKSRNRDLEQPINPRVNPIFVWVRQEDTRIVEVKCEDYDKRNRILLTKTPQGWRATPRTETLVPSQKEEDDRKHHHRSKRSKKSKIKQKSTAVQVEDLHFNNEQDTSLGDLNNRKTVEDSNNREEVEDSNNQEEVEDLNNREELEDSQPDWESPVNVETLLPSHKIHVHRKNSHQTEESVGNDVNSAVDENAQIVFKCSDTSPLDNLLAVAELEFNEQIQSEQWKNSNHHSEDQTFENTVNNKDKIISMEDMEHLQKLIESCSQEEEDKLKIEDNMITTSQKDECDYTEDEENNLIMNDILSRLEQSLRSPDIVEMHDNQCDTKEREETDSVSSNTKDIISNPCDNLNDINEPEICLENSVSECEKQLDSEINVGPRQEEPTDLSVKTMRDLTIEIPIRNDYFEQPTDLSVPKQNILTQINSTNYRPPSQDSDALQSPQPSGLPAILPSPGIISPGTANVSQNTKEKNSDAKKEQLIDDVQKNPLDLGKCRKSASPTVTCSEEVNTKMLGDEPPLKKHRASEPNESSDFLRVVPKKVDDVDQTSQKPPDIKKSESEVAPIVQLHQLLLDETLNIPDPMLVPKKILKNIIVNPGTEIPLLLKNRPELRLPEALEFPHLLQDPDILVITIQQLEEIVKQQSPIPKQLQTPNERLLEKNGTKSNEKETFSKLDEHVRINPFLESKEAKISKDYSDIDMSSAALNQLLWLPYIDQCEALQLRNSELMMALANSNIRGLSHSGNLSHLMSNNGFQGVPGNFRMPTFNNTFEMQMWQDSLLQAGLLGQKNLSHNYEMKNPFKDLLGRPNYEDINRKYMHNQKYSMGNKYAVHNQFFQPSHAVSGLSNPYLNQPQMCQVNMRTRMPSMSYPTSHKNANIQNIKGNYAHRHSTQEKPYNQGTIRMKPAHKLMKNVRLKNDAQNLVQQPKEKYAEGKTGHKVSIQPIDLSGASSTVGEKMGVRKHQQMIDSLNHWKHSRSEDVGEVGSTTASIEEMQEAHKHLWHPLFGTDKSHNGWNLPPSMAISSE